MVKKNFMLFNFIFIVLIISVNVCLVSFGATTYENMNYNLVDSGKHMDWAGSTKYSSAWNQAVSKWNSRHNVIRKDTLFTVLDVTISDYSQSGTSTVAYTSSNGTIRFNVAIMDYLNDDQLINVTLHELGHALGFGHADSSSSVMYMYNTSVNTPSNDDYLYFDYLYAGY